MIPQFRIGKIRQDLELDKLEYPPKYVLTEEDGLVCNVEYVDLRGFYPGDLRYLVSAERRIVSAAEREAGRDLNKFEELLDEMDGSGDWGKVSRQEFDALLTINVEMGMNSLVGAISACGCAPVTSCRGHKKRSYTQPEAAFWAKRKGGEFILEEAKKTDYVLLGDADVDGYHGEYIRIKNVLDAIRFADQLDHALRGKRIR